MRRARNTSIEDGLDYQTYIGHDLLSYTKTRDHIRSCLLSLLRTVYTDCGKPARIGLVATRRARGPKQSYRDGTGRQCTKTSLTFAHYSDRSEVSIRDSKVTVYPCFQNLLRPATLVLLSVPSMPRLLGIHKICFESFFQ